MISFSKILLGFITGSTLLVLVAVNLVQPENHVSASAPISENNQKIDNDQNKSTINNECSMSSSYPENIQQWCSLIMLESQKYGLEPNFIAAVMLQESGGDPNAYSSSGAVGLMQIMPKDGIAEKFICINGPCFANRPSMQELYNPQFNIEFGTKMLSNLINKYGNTRDALKAYGPMDVGFAYADLVLNIYQNY